MQKWLKISVLIGLVSWMTLVKADIAFDVIGVGGQQFPIALTPFAGEREMSQAITPIVQADLTSSGLFKLINIADILPIPTLPAQIKYDVVAMRGIQTQLLGSVQPSGNGYAIRFWLVDIVQRKTLFAYETQAIATDMRRVGHEIADLIYQALTGKPGVFSTKIAFVVRHGRQHQLQVADADGFNAKVIVASSEPIISPKWSPDGTRLAYVSFERKKPIIFVQDVRSGARRAVAAFKGNNSAPAWAPNGSQLAVVLTQDGHSQIYLMGANGEGLRRLTTSHSIDTEPSFSPDGKSIIFTSDRGGSPQIYQVLLAGGTPTRLSYTGSYNASAKFSPDGQSIVMIHRAQGGYKVAIMDVATRQIATLSDSMRDDSPSFAPNGQMILYESELGGRGTLAAVSIDGRVKQRLQAHGDIRQPAWGPLPKQ
jgi:TolB protein